MNFRLAPHPSRMSQTACDKTLCYYLFYLSSYLASLHLIFTSFELDYSCGAEFPDISLTMCYEDHIALWSFKTFSMIWMSYISSAALQPSLLCSGGFPSSVGEVLRKDSDEQEEIPN